MSILSKLKLCFLAGTLEHGGAERQLFYILQALLNAGASLRVLSLDQGEFWEEKIKALGIPVTWVGEHPSRLRRLFRILEEVRKDPPDVLQSQHFHANAYVGLVSRLTGAVGIGALRSNGQMEMSESGPLGGWLNLHCPGIIAANSQESMRFAATRGMRRSRLFFLPNVVDTTSFRPPEDVVNEPFTLIAVGRLVTEKRLDRFISILAGLRSTYQLNVRGLIVGGGCPDENLRPALEHQAKQLGMGPNIVEFRGSVADTHSVYREASVCVLNSDYEGTPNVLLEAMASGLPVVTSNVGGVPDIVQHGQTGYMLNAADIGGFGATLAGLARNSRLRTEMGQRARSFVEQNHSLQRLPVYLERLYQFALPTMSHRRTAAVQNTSTQTRERSPHGV
jgi:glycosyltransferase involved in cell wall biosynthesis